LREIDRTAFWDFCNKIGHDRTHACSNNHHSINLIGDRQ
jgi:hypothetical protein